MSHWQYQDYAEPLFTARTALPTYVPPLDADPPRAPQVVALAVAACFFVPAPVQAQQPLGWDHPLSEPTHVEHVLQYKTGAEDPLEVPAFQQLDWFQPLSEPERHPARALDYATWAERPLEIPRSQHVTWFQPLSEPVRPTPPVVPGTGAERPVTFVRHARLDWLTALSEPQFLRHRLFPEESFVPFIAPPVGVSIGWFQPLSEPVRRPYHWLLPLTVEEPVLPWTPPAAVAYWHPSMEPGPRPVPNVGLLMPMSVGPAFPIPTPPPGPGGGNDQFGIGQKRSFSDAPILGGGGSW